MMELNNKTSYLESENRQLQMELSRLRGSVNESVSVNTTTQIDYSKACQQLE